MRDNGLIFYNILLALSPSCRIKRSSIEDQLKVAFGGALSSIGSVQGVKQMPGRLKKTLREQVNNRNLLFIGFKDTGYSRYIPSGFIGESIN